MKNFEPFFFSCRIKGEKTKRTAAKERRRKEWFKMKKIFSLALAGALTLSSMAAMAADDNKVIVNGNEIAADYIITEAGEKMIPLRGVCEELGFEVKWIEESRAIELVKGPVFITCSPDFDGYAFSRMAHQPLGTAPVLLEGTTYVPASFVNEILGGTIDTAEDIKITYGEEKTEGETPADALPTASVYATQIGENSLTVMDFTLGEVILNITEATEIVDAAGNAIELSAIDTAMQLNVTYDVTMTASIPAQTNAVKIAVTNEIAKIVKEGKVTEIVKDEEGNIVQLILGENEVALNVADETVVKHADGSEKTPADITVGTTLKARTNGMSTMSIPAQMPALEIVIF